MKSRLDVGHQVYVPKEKAHAFVVERMEFPEWYSYHLRQSTAQKEEKLLNKLAWYRDKELMSVDVI